MTSPFFVAKIEWEERAKGRGLPNAYNSLL